MKKIITRTLTATALLLATHQAFALEAPKRTECIAPAKPGGGFDLTCKLIQVSLQETKAIDKPMRVTYMPGGVGAVAYNAIVAQRPAEFGTVVAFSGGSLLNLSQGKFGRYNVDDVKWLYNITPGPAMFTEQPDIVWGLIAALLIANVILLIMNLPLVGLFTRMLTIPLWFLVPAIAAVSAVGVYAVHSTTFDLLLMVGLGVFGYILRKMHFPMSPLILGFVLGEMLEQNLRRALSISNGEFSILWGSGIAQTLLVLAVSVLVLPLLLRRVRKRRLTAEAAKAE